MEELLPVLSKFLSLSLSVKYAHGQVQHQIHKFSLKECKLGSQGPHHAISKYTRRNQSESTHILQVRALIPRATRLCCILIVKQQHLHPL